MRKASYIGNFGIRRPEGKTRLTTILATTHVHMLGAATSSGTAGGGTHYTGLLLVFINHDTFGNPDDPCHKCYRPLYHGKTQGSYFSFHTFISHHCSNSSQGDTCIQNDWMYKVTKTVGSKQGCPRGDKWVCFPTSQTREQRKEQDLIQDLIRERIRINKTKKTDTATHHSEANPCGGLYAKLREQLENETEIPKLGENFFVDLGERISRELNVTSCWDCGGALISEEWPWKGSSLGPVELLKWNRSKIKRGKSDRGVDIKFRHNWRGVPLPYGKRIFRQGQTSYKSVKVHNGTFTWWMPGPISQDWTQERKKNCKYEKEIKIFRSNDSRKNPYYGIPEISKFWENMNYQRNK